MKSNMFLMGRNKAVFLFLTIAFLLFTLIALPTLKRVLQIEAASGGILLLSRYKVCLISIVGHHTFLTEGQHRRKLCINRLNR